MATTTLYRFYDAAGTLLYIGIAGNPGRRFNDHAKAKPWWPQVASSTMEHHVDREAALTAEARAIAAEHPVHNVVHNHKPGTLSGFRWTCLVCRRAITDNDGYIECERWSGSWRALHRACDPDVENDNYWIAVERISTAPAIAAWDVHLGEKEWIWATNWTCLMARFNGVDPTPNDHLCWSCNRRRDDCSAHRSVPQILPFGTRLPTDGLRWIAS